MEIQIQKETYDKIMHWINKSSNEVSGFGKCTYWHETGVLEIHDAYLLKQTNGAAHTDIDGASLAQLMFKTKDEPGELKWWWHSHVNMAVFWSGTDTATIKELASQGWMAATVFNKKEEHRSALGYVSRSEMFGNQVTIVDEIKTFIMTPVDDEITQAWDKEYTDNVEERTYAAPSYSGYSVYNSRDDYGYDYGLTGYKYNKNETKVAKDSWTQDYEYYRRYGWTGAGAVEEAEYLGLRYHEYMRVLLANEESTISEMKQYDVRLSEGIESGALVMKEENKHGA